jgi:hypothetical protein
MAGRPDAPFDNLDAGISRHDGGTAGRGRNRPVQSQSHFRCHPTLQPEFALLPPVEGAGGRWMVLRNSGEWRQMAEDARAIAAEMEEAEAKQTMLEIAAAYDRLAARADRRDAEEGG